MEGRGKERGFKLRLLLPSRWIRFSGAVLGRSRELPPLKDWLPVPDWVPDRVPDWVPDWVRWKEDAIKLARLLLDVDNLLGIAGVLCCGLCECCECCECCKCCEVCEPMKTERWAPAVPGRGRGAVFLQRVRRRKEERKKGKKSERVKGRKFNVRHVETCDDMLRHVMTCEINVRVRPSTTSGESERIPFRSTQHFVQDATNERLGRCRAVETRETAGCLRG